jgi:aspartate/methionine/tyrosine aminotransferase
MAEPSYYDELREKFVRKRIFAVKALEALGFHAYDSGSAFYLWARIPDNYEDAMQLNEFLIKHGGVAAVPGSAFADSDAYDRHMRFCIAREDEVLQSALGKLQATMAAGGI